MKKKLLGFLIFVALVAPAGATLIDFTISQDGSSQHKLLLTRPALVSSPYELPLIESGPLAGSYGSIEPGWDGEGTDRPAESRFALLSPTGISIRRLSFDPGFAMFTEGLDPILETDGATHEFEGEPESPELLWHQHLTFIADASVPVGSLLNARFELFDRAGLHAASDVFTLTFRVVPEPTTAIVTALLALFVRRKRV